jgi:hypothetical protein
MVRFAVFSVIAVTQAAHSHSHARVATITSKTNSIRDKMMQFAEGKLSSSDLPTSVELDALSAEMVAEAHALEVNRSIIQASLDSAKAAVEGCNTQYEEHVNTTVADAWAAVASAADVHDACRANLAEHGYPSRDLACQLRGVYRVAVISDLNTNIPCVSETCGDYAANSAGCSDCQDQANQWYVNHHANLVERIENCSTWTSDTSDAHVVCDENQSALETLFCVYGGEVQAGMDVLDSCHPVEYTEWENETIRAQDDEAIIKAMLVASIKIDCFVDVVDIIANATAYNATYNVELTLGDYNAILDKVRDCLALDPDTSVLDILYEDPDNKLEPTLADYQLDQTPADLFYVSGGTKTYTDAGYELAQSENCSDL